MAEAKPPSTILVAAIDFGTTYSGYAFSFRDKPDEIHTNLGWNAGSEKLLSLKTPTCVLLNQAGEFDSFGFEAENRYVELSMQMKHEGWRFFRQFKMLLHKNKKLTRESTVDDIEGNPTKALTIFTMSIKYLKKHLQNAISTQGNVIVETDIQFILTVPAIWDDGAKQFMREAAIGASAGIDTIRLKLALEPEAASIWCATLGSDARKALAGAGTQFMVVDLGGGTADISVHEKKEDGTLKEIHRASGGPWGGTNVDKNYLKSLGDIFGTQAIADLKKVDISDYFDILRDFEAKKRTFTPETVNKMTMRASAMLRELSEKSKGQKLEDALSSMPLADKVSIRRDKFRVDPSLIQTWFDEPIDKVIKHIKDLLAEPKLAAVQTILLAGGFGESLYVQERIKFELNDKRLIVPEEAGLAVLKGAVRFGHDLGAISCRVSKYTYGLSMKLPYNKKEHPVEKKKIVNGKAMASDCFDPFVKIDEEIGNDHQITQQYLPMKHTSVFDVFRSINKNPVFATDPGCEHLGTLRIRRPESLDLKGEETDVTFMFGGTELLVKVRSKKIGSEEYMTVDCL